MGTDGMRTALTAGAVGAGTVGGVFFAFSTFVMRALGRLPAAHGVSAMQAINTAAPTAWFMVPLFGTAVLGLGITVRALGRLDEPGAVYEAAGGALYLTGVVLTAAYHVPRNDHLATLDPQSVEAASAWASYLRDWTAVNHVRAATSLAAAVSWTVALRQSSGT